MPFKQNQLFLAVKLPDLALSSASFLSFYPAKAVDQTVKADKVFKIFIIGFILAMAPPYVYVNKYLINDCFLLILFQQPKLTSRNQGKISTTYATLSSGIQRLSCILIGCIFYGMV